MTKCNFMPYLTTTEYRLKITLENLATEKKEAIETIRLYLNYCEEYGREVSEERLGRLFYNLNHIKKEIAFHKGELAKRPIKKVKMDFESDTRCYFKDDNRSFFTLEEWTGMTIHERINLKNEISAIAYRKGDKIPWGTVNKSNYAVCVTRYGISEYNDPESDRPYRRNTLYCFYEIVKEVCKL